jgi:hypothetical protein
MPPPEDGWGPDGCRTCSVIVVILAVAGSGHRVLVLIFMFIAVFIVISRPGRYLSLSRLQGFDLSVSFLQCLIGLVKLRFVSYHDLLACDGLIDACTLGSGSHGPTDSLAE